MSADDTRGGGKVDLGWIGAQTGLRSLEHPLPGSQVPAQVPSGGRPCWERPGGGVCSQSLLCCCRRPTETWRPRWCVSTADETSPAPSSLWPTSTPVSLGRSHGGGPGRRWVCGSHLPCAPHPQGRLLGSWRPLCAAARALCCLATSGPPAWRASLGFLAHRTNLGSPAWVLRGWGVDGAPTGRLWCCLELCFRGRVRL